MLHLEAEEARRRGVLGAVILEADNGNIITMVIGGEETVLGFDYGHHNRTLLFKQGTVQRG